jgi:hypothetical protein
MKKTLFTFALISSSLMMFSCSSQQQVLQPIENVESLAKKDDISIKVELDNPPFLSQQKNEISGIARMSDGKLIRYQTLKDDKGKVTATTIVYRTKWEIQETHSSTPTEANTILKLSSQGGHFKEYKELKARYESLGLVD